MLTPVPSLLSLTNVQINDCGCCPQGTSQDQAYRAEGKEKGKTPSKESNEMGLIWGTENSSILMT